MIAGIFHQGSGCGDQLFRYITTRVIAEEKGFDWGMLNPDNFKGASFMKLDLGKPTEAPLPKYDHQYQSWPQFTHNFEEKDIRDSNGVDIRSYDPEINFIEDNTTIDGNFEDEKYWGHRFKDIRSWLEVDAIAVPDDVCVIGFRGGEYYTDPDLGLPKEYWIDAVTDMYIKGITKYEVHTDDERLARSFFKDILQPHTTHPIYPRYIQDIGINWRSMRFAKHAIIANSAFYIMPRLLKHSHSDSITIAPRYWARRNTKTWARPACYYKAFQYV